MTGILELKSGGDKELSQEGKIINIWQTLQILGLTFALHYLGFFVQTYRDR